VGSWPSGTFTECHQQQPGRIWDNCRTQLGLVESTEIVNEPTMKRSRLITFTATLLFCPAAQTWSQTQPPAEPPKPQWQSSAAAGLTLTRGNAETFLATLTGTTTRKWEKNELSLGADATYGKSKDQTTGQTTKSADAYRGFVQYNRLFSERLYGYARAEGQYDAIADVKYRVTLSPGAGYYLIKEKTTDLSVEVGPGYVIQKLGNDSSSFATLRVGEKFHQAISDRARIWQTAEWLPKLEDFNNYIINAEVGIEADLTQDRKLSLRSYLQVTYNSVPASGRKNNDLKLVTAIAYRF
jgi:putative salt-induced outer membrane protein